MMLLTCALIIVVDGDTVKCDGTSVRLLGDGAPNVRGIDTPEIRNFDCLQEQRLGIAAAERLEELLKDAVGIRTDVTADFYGRILGSVVLKDGRTAGQVLLEEGYAREWFPGYKADWCGPINS